MHISSSCFRDAACFSGVQYVISTGKLSAPAKTIGSSTVEINVA